MMSVPVRSAEDLAFEVRGGLNIHESHDFAVLSDSADAALDALVALADEAAKFKRAHEVAAKFANQNIERAVNAEARVAELERERDEALRVASMLRHTEVCELKEARERVAELETALQAARKLVYEHHSLGAMDGLEWGGRCPVCAKHDDLARLAAGSPTGQEQQA